MVEVAKVWNSRPRWFNKPGNFSSSGKSIEIPSASRGNLFPFNFLAFDWFIKVVATRYWHDIRNGAATLPATFETSLETSNVNRRIFRGVILRGGVWDFCRLLRTGEHLEWDTRLVEFATFERKWDVSGIWCQCWCCARLLKNVSPCTRLRVYP